MKKLIAIILITNLILINSDSSSETITFCNNKGVYNTSSGECKCVEGNITFPKDSKLQCNYELRSYNITKFLSVFGGFFGADMFYLGYTLKGLIKTLFPIIAFFFIINLENNKYLSNFSFKNYLILLPILLTLFLWIIDLIIILSGFSTDSNGMQLYNN